MARNTLSINGTDISTFGIYISSDTYLDAPKIDYAEFEIPAKNGTAILDRKRLNNVIRKFDCYIPEIENIQTGMDKLKKLLYLNRGYLTISSSYEADWYQYGYLAQEINVKPFNKKAAEFSLFFSCLPQKYNVLNAINDTTHQAENRGLSGYLKNDDTRIVNLLARATLDYPFSPIGWVDTLHDPQKELSAGSYSVTCTSSTTQKYIVVLHQDIVVDQYEIIGEVSNYSDTFSFNVPSSQTRHYYVGVLFPIMTYDQTVNMTVDNGVINQKTSIYNQITSPNFIDVEAIGANPVFMYKKPVNVQYTDGGKDLFVVNDNMYLVDYTSLYEDYGRQSLIDSAVHYDADIQGNCFYVYLDLKQGRMLFLDSFDAQASVDIDASGYFFKYGTDSMENSGVITAKFQTYFGGFTAAEIDEIKYQPGWWKL